MNKLGRHFGAETLTTNNDFWKPQLLKIADKKTQISLPYCWWIRNVLLQNSNTFNLFNVINIKKNEIEKQIILKLQEIQKQIFN